MGNSTMPATGRDGNRGETPGCGFMGDVGHSHSYFTTGA